MAMDTRVRPTGHLLPYQPSYQVRPAPHSRFAVTLITVATALVGAVLFVGGLMLIAALFVMVSLVASVGRGGRRSRPRCHPQGGTAGGTAGGPAGPLPACVDRHHRPGIPAHRFDEPILKEPRPFPMDGWDFGIPTYGSTC